MSGLPQSFPILKLTPDDLALLWALVDRYPAQRDKRYVFNVWGFHPSVSVKGLIKDIFGDRP